MSKMVKVLVLVAILIATLAVSPAQACGASDWSMMSNEEIVSTVNRIEDEPRVWAGQHGELPPPSARVPIRWQIQVSSGIGVVTS